jgi:hypothetical protein
MPRPQAPDSGDFVDEAELVRVATGMPDEVQGGEHIVGDLRIDAPKVGRVPAAVFGGVMPCQQEVCHAPGLSGIAPGDVKQPRKRE